MPDDTARHPQVVSILGLGRYLIASIHTALDDGQLTRFQYDLVEQVGRDQSHGSSSISQRSMCSTPLPRAPCGTLARMAGLRGARTVIVGINPDTAAALARLGMPPGIAPTAADLDDAIAILEETTV